MLMEVIGICIILEAALMNYLSQEAPQTKNSGVVVYRSTPAIAQERDAFQDSTYACVAKVQQVDVS
jgi:hypothetical protein